jgi:cephalosporin hydroxylase
MSEFEQDIERNIERVRQDRAFLALTQNWLLQAIDHQYAKNFSWLGRPIIQIPQDIYAIQELVWRVKPDLIIETGVAHGGSLILSASLLALLDYCDASEKRLVFSPAESRRRVVGVDIEIRPHNRKAIEAHPLAHLIEMIEASSIDIEVVKRIRTMARGFERILVFLDSDHTHKHVLAELEAYAPLVSPGSYCVVWDTGVEDLPDGFVKNRPWGKGNNPRTAMNRYLATLQGGSAQALDGTPLCFEIDRTIAYKLLITASLDGFLRRV